MSQHRSLAELDAALAALAPSPKDGGAVEMIVVRPAPGQRRVVDEVAVSFAGGLAGDHWALGCWKSLPDGRPDPDVQVCLMNARVIEMVAGGRENWAPAGDNLFVDLDLSPASLPAGTRLAVGSAVLEITDVPHNGCAGFVERYGRDACAFVNRGRETHRLRGVYARVVQGGVIRTGDRLLRSAADAAA